MEEVLGKFTAQRIDNGEVIEGNLICGENSPFVYILTEENFKRMIVDDEGNCKCTLIRVMKKSLNTWKENFIDQSVVPKRSV